MGGGKKIVHGAPAVASSSSSSSSSSSVSVGEDKRPVELPADQGAVDVDERSLLPVDHVKAAIRLADHAMRTQAYAHLLATELMKRIPVAPAPPPPVDPATLHYFTCLTCTFENTPSVATLECSMCNTRTPPRAPVAPVAPPPPPPVLSPLTPLSLEDVSATPGLTDAEVEAVNAARHMLLTTHTMLTRTLMLRARPDSVATVLTPPPSRDRAAPLAATPVPSAEIAQMLPNDGCFVLLFGVALPLLVLRFFVHLFPLPFAMMFAGAALRALQGWSPVSFAVNAFAAAWRRLTTRAWLSTTPLPSRNLIAGTHRLVLGAAFVAILVYRYGGSFIATISLLAVVPLAITMGLIALHLWAKN